MTGDVILTNMEKKLQLTVLMTAIGFAILLSFYVASYVGLRLSNRLEVDEREVDSAGPGLPVYVYADIVYYSSSSGLINKGITKFYSPLSWFEITCIMRKEYVAIEESG